MSENYIYAYNLDGTPGGFYLKSIHGDGIPEPNIEITEEQHDFCMNHNGWFKLDLETMQFVEISQDPSDAIKGQLSALDNPRDAEDVFNALKAKGILTGADISQQTRERFLQKKALRDML